MPKYRPAAVSPPRVRWKCADARAVVEALAASGLSLEEFARREGLKVARLCRWRDRLAAEARGSAPDAAPKVIELRSRGAEPIEVVLSSGRILRVAETIDVAALARLVAALERP